MSRNPHRSNRAHNEEEQFLNAIRQSCVHGSVIAAGRAQAQEEFDEERKASQVQIRQLEQQLAASEARNNALRLRNDQATTTINELGGHVQNLTKIVNSGSQASEQERVKSADNFKAWQKGYSKLQTENREQAERIQRRDHTIQQLNARSQQDHDTIGQQNQTIQALQNTIWHLEMKLDGA